MLGQKLILWRTLDGTRCLNDQEVEPTTAFIGHLLCARQREALGGVGGGVGGGGGADIMSKTPEALPCPLLSWESDINHNHICERVIITVQCQEGFRDIRVGVKKDFPEKKYVSIYSLSTHLCLDPRRRLRGP